MVGKQVALLPFIALLLLSASFAQEASQNAHDIRQVDFKNSSFTRSRDETGAKPIELRDGKHVSESGAESFLMRVAYGDLTNDGVEEAIILLRGQNNRISRTLDEVFVYTLKSGKPVALAHFNGGKRGEYILSIGSLGSNFKVENSLLVLDQAILRESEDVPTQYYTIKYHWNGIQMVEVERSALKPIPENMMEVG